MSLQINELNCDILVAGGGAAGLPCALAAARCGAKVILCQDRPVLGGNASSEVRMHIVGANGTGSSERGSELETEAREGGIIEEIRLENSVRNPQRSASMFDLILYDMCRMEPNLTLLLNTTVTKVIMEKNKIQSAVAERQSTEDQFHIRAEVFIDCTGDGRLGFEAGAAFREGRENKEMFGERLAMDKEDQQRLGSTILLQARKHDCPMPFVAPDWVRQFTKEDLKLRLYASPGDEEPTHEYGYWWAEWGGTLDTIKENETIRDELLAVTLGIWNHLKNANDDPFGAANWALDWIGFLPGKRESRRFIGQHILTEHDLLTSRTFEDAIAYGGWSLDLHPPEGIDLPHIEPCQQHPVPYLYDIPLRSTVARDVTNLMFAGRNISASHVAFSSTRVMATCAVVGQGVGTAAAYAVQNDISIQTLATNPIVMQTIQQRLLRDDVFLIDVVNNDPNDIARCAMVTASTEISGGEAMNVISGMTRSVHGERGVSPARVIQSRHRWISDAAHQLPAWLQFEWDDVVTIKEVQLIFDTGLHRHLTLSHHDGYTQSMQWGKPQPETVNTYTIELFNGEQSEIIFEVAGNYQRLQRHVLQATKSAQKLRINVHQTNGIDHARIVEVRLYADELR